MTSAWKSATAIGPSGSVRRPAALSRTNSWPTRSSARANVPAGAWIGSVARPRGVTCRVRCQPWLRQGSKAVGTLPTTCEKRCSATMVGRSRSAARAGQAALIGGASAPCADGDLAQGRARPFEIGDALVAAAAADHGEQPAVAAEAQAAIAQCAAAVPGADMVGADPAQLRREEDPAVARRDDRRRGAIMAAAPGGERVIAGEIGAVGDLGAESTAIEPGLARGEHRRRPGPHPARGGIIGEARRRLVLARLRRAIALRLGWRRRCRAARARRRPPRGEEQAPGWRACALRS